MKAQEISDETLQEIFNKMFNDDYVVTVDTMYEYIRNGEYAFKDDNDLKERIARFF